MSIPLETVVAHLRSPDMALRRKALVALVRSGDPRALPFLDKLASEDPEAEIRYYARKGIMHLRGVLAEKGQAPGRAPRERVNFRQVNPEALSKALEAPEEGTRLKAIRIVLDYDAKELLPRLLARLGAESSHLVLSSLAFAAGKLGRAEHARHLLPLLQHEDPRVRANAIEALDALGDNSVFVHLVPFLRDPDNRCRANAVLALRKYGKVNVFRTLEAMLRSDEVWMQDSATYCLGQMGASNEVFGLLELAGASEFAVVRRQARGVLGTLASRGVDRAAELLRRQEADEARAETRSENPEGELFDRLAALSEAAAEEGTAVPDVAGDLSSRLAGLGQMAGISAEEFRRRAEAEADRTLVALQNVHRTEIEMEKTREELLTERLAAVSGGGDYDAEAEARGAAERRLTALSTLAASGAEDFHDARDERSIEVLNRLRMLKE